MVRLSRTNTRGIVLQLYPGSTMYVGVYWLGYMQHASYPAYELEVISEGG